MKYRKTLIRYNVYLKKLHFTAVKIHILLSYDVVFGSVIMSCNKIDLSLVAYRFTGNVHNNVAYIMTKYNVLTTEMRFQS